MVKETPWFPSGVSRPYLTRSADKGGERRENERMAIPVGWRVTDEEGSLLRAKKDPSYSPVIGADVLQKKRSWERERAGETIPVSGTGQR